MSSQVLSDAGAMANSSTYATKDGTPQRHPWVTPTLAPASLQSEILEQRQPEGAHTPTQTQHNSYKFNNPHQGYLIIQLTECIYTHIEVACIGQLPERLQVDCVTSEPFGCDSITLASAMFLLNLFIHITIPLDINRRAKISVKTRQHYCHSPVLFCPIGDGCDANHILPMVGSMIHPSLFLSPSVWFLEHGRPKVVQFCVS